MILLSAELQTHQSSITRPGIWPKSFLLRVTEITLFAKTMAAIFWIS